MSSGLQISAATVIPNRRQRWLDGFAVTASVLCLIHCLLLPAIVIALPVLATMLAVPRSFHAIAFALALPASTLAMASGYRRHRQRLPFFMAACGLTLIGVGAFAVPAEAAERAVSSAGAVLLAVAHVWNWRAVSHGDRARPSCPAEDKA